MERFVLGCGLAILTSLAIGLAAAPAHADFYTLDGRFQCLDHANAICGDARPLVSIPPAAKSDPAPPAPAPVVAVAPAPVMHHVAPPIPRAADPLHEIALRVQAGKPMSGDLAWLKQAADRGNPRAIELLAWCKLNAVGTVRDPVAAYLLYGAAADAAVPHARQNQGVIYERDLNLDQRQQVLDLVNEGVALARLSPTAQ
jgi:hypothetical protein